MAGEEQQRQRVAGPRQRGLQVEPADLRHLQVGHDAAGRILLALGEEVASPTT